MLFYLHNESPIIEHQFTSGGLFDFVYCACALLWGHGSRADGGSRSAEIVEQSTAGSFGVVDLEFLFPFFWVFSMIFFIVQNKPQLSVTRFTRVRIGHSSCLYTR